MFMCCWVCFGELGCLCVIGFVLESWEVSVCLGLFLTVGMCMCVWGCFGELGCVCVVGCLFGTVDVCVGSRCCCGEEICGSGFGYV